MVDYMKLMRALECCSSGDEKGCDRCPYLAERCDDPFVEYTVIPGYMVEDIKLVLREGVQTWERSRSKKPS